MRILLATYPWAFETPGGGEIQLQKYAEYLPSHGFEVSLHDPWRPNLAGASVCHFFSCVGGSVHFCAYVKKRGYPLVISSSLWIREETRSHYPTGEIQSQLSFADVIVTNSKAESELLARVLSIPLDRFIPVLNGFEPRFLTASPQPFREAFDIRDGFVLNVGNIEPRKNQLALVRALKGTNLSIVFIGHCRDQAYANQVFAEAGPQARYLGPIDHDDPHLASAFAACSIFVLPSTLETPGLAALEAAAAGAAVVVTSEGCAQEYFGDMAHYVDPNDQRDIRNGIERALAAGPNPALKAHVASSFTWPTVTKGLQDAYGLALQRNHYSGA